MFFAGILTGQAQLYKSLFPSSEFSDSLSKIVNDYQSNFHLIQGREMKPQPEMSVYQSTTTLPEALHCSIFRFHSIIDTTASWQAIFYDGDNYKEAIKIYREIFKQIKNCNIKTDGNNKITFIGDFGKPKESVRFASSSLRLDTDELIYRDFYAELQLTATYDGWEVQLNLLNKIMN